jgi:DNA-directed RNA polymerase subunit M/transcription elongation factor TFIIS
MTVFAGNGRLAIGVLDAAMCAIQGKDAKSTRQTCPNCKHSKILRPVRPTDEQPRKSYCTECGHEWWEFEKKPFEPADPRGA